jgi:hypothetical protein
MVMTDSAQPPQPPVSWSPPQQPAPGDSRQPFDFNSFISFRYLITPTLVTVIYVIGAVAISIVALGSLLAGGSSAIINGVLVFLFGNLYWRVILEFIMVLFRMNEAVQSIDRRGRGM